MIRIILTSSNEYQVYDICTLVIGISFSQENWLMKSMCHQQDSRDYKTQLVADTAAILFLNKKFQMPCEDNWRKILQAKVYGE